MDYEMVCKMTVDELNRYLRLLWLKVSGKRAELVARVFIAAETNVQPVKTAQEIEHELMSEYQTKLLHGDVLLSGSLSEDDGIISWPCLTYILIFLTIGYFTQVNSVALT